MKLMVMKLMDIQKRVKRSRARVVLDQMEGMWMYIHMCDSLMYIGIKDNSVTYFNCIAAIKVLYCWPSIKGGFLTVWVSYESMKHTWACHIWIIMNVKYTVWWIVLTSFSSSTHVSVCYWMKLCPINLKLTAVCVNQRVSRFSTYVGLVQTHNICNTYW